MFELKDFFLKSRVPNNITRILIRMRNCFFPLHTSAVIAYASTIYLLTDTKYKIVLSNLVEWNCLEETACASTRKCNHIAI
jgi:hypothetical protein